MILREAEDGTTNEKVPEGQTQTCQQKHVLRRDSPVLEERAPALSQEDHQPQGRKHANPEGEIKHVLKKLRHSKHLNSLVEGAGGIPEQTGKRNFK